MQVDGTVIIERGDENERFYGQRIGVADILAGKARHPPYEVKMLMETLKAAEGSNDVDESMMLRLADEPAPADMELSTPNADAYVFGIPEPDDPDPFGVLALEKEGFEIREAGSGSRPTSTQFEFNPSPTSPVFSKFHRRSMDTIGTRSNRESYMSNRSALGRMSIDRGTQTGTGTQTDEQSTPITSPSLSDRDRRIDEEDEKGAFNSTDNDDNDDIDYTKVDLRSYRSLTAPLEPDHNHDGASTNSPSSPRARAPSTTDTSITTDTDDEEPVVFEAAAALTPQAGLAIKARGGLVNIPKRPPPPPLPPRNGARSSGIFMVDQASGRSPMRSEFEEVSLHGGRESLDSRRSVLSSRTEVGQEKEKVVEVEKVEKEVDIPLADKVQHEPGELHLDTAIVPEVVTDDEKTAVLENGSTAEHANGLMPAKTNAEMEEDNFHSLPSSPMEVAETK